jgi:hypothetical protein
MRLFAVADWTEPKKVRRTKQFAVRLSDEERARLDRLTEHYGIDVASVVRMVIKKDYDLVVKSCRDEAIKA